MGLIEKQTKQIKEMKLMMERLESPRLTETELQIKKNLLIESVHSNKSPIPGDSKPRFGPMELNFDSKVDEALYIVFNEKLKSKAESEFLKWLSTLEYTQEEMSLEGGKIKEFIKNSVRDRIKADPKLSWSNWSEEMSGNIDIPQMGSEPKPKEK